MILKKAYIYIILFTLLLVPNTSISNAIEVLSDTKKKVIDPTDDAISHNNKGMVYLEKGYPLHAISEFKLAIMLNPNSYMSASLYNNLGKAYEKIREYDHAIASYQHAIKINPDFAVYYKNLVNAYNNKKVINKVQKDYEKILEVNPKDAEASFILGLIYMKQNQNIKAIELFNKYITLEPNRALASAAKKYIFNLKNPD